MDSQSNPTVHTTLGWKFQSELSLEEMKSELNRPGKVEWKLGDSTNHGDYLGGRITPEAIVRIYNLGGNEYHVNMKFYSTQTENVVSQLDNAKSILMNEIFSQFHVENVIIAEPLE